MFDIDVMTNDELDDYTMHMQSLAVINKSFSLAIYWMAVFNENCNVRQKTGDEIWC